MYYRNGKARMALHRGFLSPTRIAFDSFRYMEIPEKVTADKAYQNVMRNSDKQNARIEHDKALQRVMMDLLSDHTELFKQFCDNPGFKKWLSDTVFGVIYQI